MDMKLAFLTSALEEEVYVEQPSSFFISKEDQVFALNKALYGLRQVPRAWYVKLHASLNSIGFIHSDHEHAVYTRCIVSRPLVVGIYVDDLLITGPVDDDANKFKAEMWGQFRMIVT
jgi:hypothetical protein